ncbi:MAG: glucose-6-phosphate dehydrogenase [Nitrospinae bacterium CG11_big_fil_rev_8_21_14_0_20_56_8]|nr:MAG: glucose-6-phosphate dehydrogenase [Nitrospinae bacterium CG11_big_fil_rev_8_21_14_0_20_56_8]
MERPQNCILVIFGASGDLTQRKLVPALMDLFRLNLLPKSFVVLGVGRKPWSDEDFRVFLGKSLNEFSHSRTGPEETAKFLGKFFFLSLDPQDGEGFRNLKNRLKELDRQFGIGENYMYYLSTPPSLFDPIVRNLGANNLQREESRSEKWKRLIIEKPFGYDLASARALIKKIRKVFREPQIYRIDHYLGKETVQNILVFRFANGIFEPLWNRHYVHHVEITAAESIGVEDRGGYYEGTGVVRDMIQNHLLQILGVVAMEPPSAFDPDAVRNETVKIFQSLRPIPEAEVEKSVVRGQYTASLIKGKNVPGYREEKGVKPDSRTETFAAMKVFVDNWRWGGVPFYIRAGKRLPTRVTEVVIHFRATPHFLFTKDNANRSGLNQLILRVQPNEGIMLKFGMKVPGGGFRVKNVSMDFLYSDLSETRLPEAYERLLLDGMLGDSTLYARGDAVEACWGFIDPILKAWKQDPAIKIYGYPAGTWGVEQANTLFMEHGVEWRYPCKNLVDDGVVCEL